MLSMVEVDWDRSSKALGELGSRELGGLRGSSFFVLGSPGVVVGGKWFRCFPGVRFIRAGQSGAQGAKVLIKRCCAAAPARPWRHRRHTLTRAARTIRSLIYVRGDADFRQDPYWS